MDAVLQRQLGAALAASVCVGLAVCALRGRSESASADDGGKREESAVRKTADGPRGHAAEPTAVGKPSPIEPADVCPGVGTSHQPLHPLMQTPRRRRLRTLRSRRPLLTVLQTRERRRRQRLITARW